MEDGKKVIILVGFLSVLLYIYCSFDDYDDYIDCNKICQKMSETECETLSIVEINEKSWTTTTMLFPGLGKSLPLLMINHNESNLKLSNGDEITVERKDITKEMFIKKKPIYRPEKTKGEKSFFEPVFVRFDYEIVE